MQTRPPKKDKSEVREKMHLTRPPRLEGRSKEAMMRAVKKPKKTPRSST